MICNLNHLSINFSQGWDEEHNCGRLNLTWCLAPSGVLHKIIPLLSITLDCTYIQKPWRFFRLGTENGERDFGLICLAKHALTVFTPRQILSSNWENWQKLSMRLPLINKNKNGRQKSAWKVDMNWKDFGNFQMADSIRILWISASYSTQILIER